MLVLRPHQREPEVIEFVAEPSVTELERIVGGPPEQVPGFLSIERDGVIHRCVALGSTDS